MEMADELWAWVTEYPDKSVGLIAVGGLEGVMMPLIGRSEQAIRKLEPYARTHGAATKQRVWLRQYTKVQDHHSVWQSGDHPAGDDA